MKWNHYRSKGFVTALTVMLLLGSLLCHSYAQELNVETFHLDRYSHLWEKSPFSAPVQNAVINKNQQWLLTGITVLDNSPIAIITNKTTGQCLSLSPGDASGPVRLVHSEWSNEPDQSFAIVEINSKQERLEFDSASLNQLAAKYTANFKPQQNKPTKVKRSASVKAKVRTRNQPASAQKKPPRTGTKIPTLLRGKLPASLQQAIESSPN